MTIIIGGGISGAAALHWLASAGVEATLFEARNRLGGVIRSQRLDDGVLMEYGPNSIQLKHPSVVRLIEELGLRPHVLQANRQARARYVVRDGAPRAVPTSPPALLTTTLLSGSARLRLLREPFVPPAREGVEESVAEFVRRRLGSEILDYAVDPFIAGVYAGRPERLSVRYAFPRLYELEQRHGSLIRGMIAARRSRGRGASPAGRGALVSFADGLQMLPDAIAERWSDRVRFGAAVERVRRERGRWIVDVDGTAVATEKLIVATDAHSAAELLAPVDRELAAALSRIEYPPLAVTVAAFDRRSVAHRLDGFGMLVPQREGRTILGVVFSSTLFTGRSADSDTVVLTAFSGGSRQPELARLATDAIEANVLAELRALLGVGAAPRWMRTHVWRRAIPQYTLGYGEILSELAAAERRTPGLRLLGNYRGGVAVGDCIAAAEDAVAETGAQPNDN